VNVLLPPARFAILFAAGLLLCVPACSAREGEEELQGQGHESTALHPVTLVEVEFLDGQTRLAGTLYQPESDTARPALALLGGSDRGPRGRMKDQLARAFSGGGVAVLTYDSPGTGRSGGCALFQTRRDRAREGLAAVRFLRSFDGIDPGRVGICGGSEGAGVALLAAGMDPDIAFAIAISGAFGMSSMDISRYRIEGDGVAPGSE
jgi:dipeptidyl aminopeptidase/acylaminoacyl peptidase